jgi:hypothetical protein
MSNRPGLETDSHKLRSALKKFLADASSRRRSWLVGDDVHNEKKLIAKTIA